MDHVNEQEVLAKIRTLLALERNFLAEERTALAEFRNGLALTVIGSTVSTIIAYVLSLFAADQSIILDVLNFTFFTVLTIVGIWISFQSQAKLKKIRKKKITIKNRTLEISKCARARGIILKSLLWINNSQVSCDKFIDLLNVELKVVI